MKINIADCVVSFILGAATAAIFLTITHKINIEPTHTSAIEATQTVVNHNQ